MPLLLRYEHGAPCWVDLSTTDLAASRDFYAGLFGWGYTDEEMGEMGIGTYSMARVNGVATAAIYEQGPHQILAPSKPRWNVYVSVDDIDATLSRVRQRGEVVLANAVQVDSAGSVAVVEDPVGCKTTLWQPEEFRGSLIRAEPGALTWPEHVSTDLARSVRFYEDVLDVDTVAAPQGNLNHYTTWIVDDIPVAGMFQWPDEIIAEGVPSMWFVYFQVTDVDAAVRYVESNGGRAMAGGPAVNDVGRMIVLRDPQGADFCVVEPHRREA